MYGISKNYITKQRSSKLSLIFFFPWLNLFLSHYFRILFVAISSEDHDGSNNCDFEKCFCPHTAMNGFLFKHDTIWSKLVLKLFYNYIIKRKHAVALKTMFRSPKKLFPIESLSDFHFYYEILSLRTPNFESYVLRQNIYQNVSMVSCSSLS